VAMRCDGPGDDHLNQEWINARLVLAIKDL
jgi:hypothetical protein